MFVLFMDYPLYVFVLRGPLLLFHLVYASFGLMTHGNQPTFNTWSLRVHVA